MMDSTPATASANPLDSTRSRVLIVDDEPANCKLLANVMKREGHVTRIATGGQQALDILDSEPIDLVLLDLMMPEVDGMAVLMQLRNKDRLPSLPVVIVTAHHDRGIRLQALRAGAIDFVSKPIDAMEVACRVRSLTELKRLRDRTVANLKGKLRESDHLLGLRFAQSPVAKIVWNKDFRVLAWNPAAEDLFGYTEEQALHQHGAFLLPKEDPFDFEAIWQEMLAGDQHETVHANVIQDEQTVLCEWHNAPLTSADGTVLGVSSVIIDITERRRLQETLVQAQKMEAIGQLAGGIAHDFNNILSVILSYGQFIQRALPQGDEIRDDIDEVLKAGHRAAKLTGQLLSFSRQQPRAKVATNLNDSLSQLHNLLTRTLGEHIDLRVKPAVCPAIVCLDPVQFDQIVLNLAVNARDAMPDGGRLSITLDCPTQPGAGHDGLGWIRLRVSDTGVGMNPETQRHIFEPFYTNKATGRGTGLGLATAYGIVTNLGGTITVESSPGQGARFTILLPLCVEETDATKPVAQVPRTGNGELVLVVEDDPALRRATARVLRSAGYEVKVACDGHDGMGQIDELGPGLDCLVTDLVMPGCSGHQLAEHAQQATLGVAVVLTSGYLDEAAQRDHPDDLPLLWKPVPPRDLVHAVASALARRPAGEFSPLPTAPPPTPGPVPTATTSPTPLDLDSSRPRPRTQRRDHVLIVDDDPALAEVATRILASGDFDVQVAGTLDAARTVLASGEFDALIVDIGLPDGSGLDLLHDVGARGTELPVVVMTGAPSVESATQALRHRVFEYLPKPFSAEALLRVSRAAVESGRIANLRTKLLTASFGGDEFVGNIPETTRAFERALPKIRMVFQPIVRAVDSTVYAYEALLRCDEESLASPLRLLAAAEVLGQVDELGRGVRAGVAAAMAAEPDRLEAIFVNLHPTEVRADLLAELSDPLLAVSKRVVLEITERGSLEAGPRLDAELSQIRALGYRIAVDDLGAGYSGLSSLVQIRPDVAKIDMSLVRDIHKAPLKRDIVAALVDMARRAGIIVVAEGVETIDERDTLVDLGCDLLQGYLFAKPGPPFPVPRADF